MKRRSVAYKSSSTTWPKGMRDVIRWKHAALLALAVLAAGCSSNSKKELPPAELTSFKEEVVLQKQWSQSIGDGQGDLYNLLQPAIDGDSIVATDSTPATFSSAFSDVAARSTIESVLVPAGTCCERETIF